MKCWYCHSDVSAENRFCKKCGRAVSRGVPATSAGLLAGARPGGMAIALSLSIPTLLLVGGVLLASRGTLHGGATNPGMSAEEAPVLTNLVAERKPEFREPAAACPISCGADEDKLAGLESQLNDEVAKRKAAELELQKRPTVVTQSQPNAASAKSLADQLVAIERRLHDTQVERDSAQRDYAELEKKLDSLAADSNGLGKTLAGATAKITELGSENSRLQQENDKLEKENAKLQEQIASLKNPVPTPSQGEIVWRGEVHGIRLVDINDAGTDVGEASGKLPGVPCFVQPQSRNVTIVDGPRASNGYRRVVLRVSGNGVITVRLTWVIQK